MMRKAVEQVDQRGISCTREHLNLIKGGKQHEEAMDFCRDFSIILPDNVR